MTVYKASTFQQGQRAFPKQQGRPQRGRLWRLSQHVGPCCSLLPKGHPNRFFQGTK